MSTDAKWLLALILSSLLGIIAILLVVSSIIPAEQLALYAYVGLVVGLLLFVYEIPAIVAYNFDHRRFLAILLANILLGWTIVGWVAAFIWACTGTRESITKPQVVCRSPVTFPRRARRTTSLRLHYRSVQIVGFPIGKNDGEHAA